MGLFQLRVCWCIPFWQGNPESSIFFMPESVGWEFDHIRTGQTGETEQEIWLPYKPEG